MDGFIMSRLYGFVRGRQLEGTFPGDPGTGVWPITSNRIQYGWGCVPEDVWPLTFPSPWPPWPEPIGIDMLAKARRISSYHRVRTTQECKWVVGSGRSVLASLEITEQWFRAPSGRIAPPHPSDAPAGGHVVVIEGYDETKAEFKFWNSWGTDWGDHGYGYIPFEVFEKIWDEGWRMRFTGHPARPQDSGYPMFKANWGLTERAGGTWHCCELATRDDERVGWWFARQCDDGIEVEEFFVRPQFRGTGHGKKLIEEIVKLATERQLPLKIWISFADAGPDNVSLIQKLIAPLGLSLKPSGVRWASLVASRGGEGLTPEELQYGPKPSARPRMPFRAQGLGASSLGARPLPEHFCETTEEPRYFQGRA